MAVGSADKTVRLWDLTNRARPAPLGQPLASADAVLSVAFSPDGRTLAVGSEDKTMRLWDLTEPTRPTPFGQPLTAVDSVAFSPDGRTLAVGSEKTVRLWRLR